MTLLFSHLFALSLLLPAPGTPPVATQQGGALAMLTARGDNSPETVLIRGRVLTYEGAPLAGATVMDAATHQCIATDRQGDFMLPVNFSKGPIRLLCGYLGYVEQVRVLPSRPDKELRFQLMKGTQPQLDVTGKTRDL